MGIMKELKSMCESLEPVSSVSETEIADSPTKSIHFNGGVDHPTYLPLTTHDFAPSVSLPDNIMADSSSSSSDNEEDNCHVNVSSDFTLEVQLNNYCCILVFVAASKPWTGRRR